MVDNNRVVPFPKSISLLSLSNSSLYNRRMASSKDSTAVADNTLSQNFNSLISSKNVFDYEELAWNVSDKPPIPARHFPNYYGNDSKTKNHSNRDGYFLFWLT